MAAPIHHPWRRRVALALSTLLVATVLPFGGNTVGATAAPVDPLDTEDTYWVSGNAGFTQLPYFGGGFTYFYTVFQNLISKQGPPHAPLRRPRANEIFYLKLETGFTSDLFADTASYRMDLLLPENVSLVRSDAYPTYCAIVKDGAVERGDGQCPLPEKVGLYWRMGQQWFVPGEIITYWLPVRASKPLSGAVTQLTSTKTSTEPSVPVNPILSSIQLNVTAGAPSAPRDVAVARGARSAKVSWSPPASTGGKAITGYSARAWTKASGGTRVGSCSTLAGGRSCTITGLQAGVKVYVDVVAKNSIGTGTPSSPRKGVTPTS